MKELNLIQTKLNAPKSQYNAFGKYKYRSCEDVLEALKPLLEETKCTLTISDDIIFIEGRFYVKATATLTNDKGELLSTTAFAREENEKKGMDGSQVTGSASSYARKYALNGLFCIDDNKDADATNTHGAKKADAAEKKPAGTLSKDEMATMYKDMMAITDKKKLWYTYKMYVKEYADFDTETIKMAVTKRYNEI